MITKRNHVGLLITVAVAGSLLYFYFDPSYHRFFPPCPFHSLTGFFCPGCGSQRAFHDILHGDLRAAAGHNLLFLLFLPLVLFAAFVALNNIFRTKKMKQAIFYSAPFANIILLVVLFFWGLRNIQAAPFNWLAP